MAAIHEVHAGRDFHRRALGLLAGSNFIAGLFLSRMKLTHSPDAAHLPSTPHPHPALSQASSGRAGHFVQTWGERPTRAAVSQLIAQIRGSRCSLWGDAGAFIGLYRSNA